NFLMTTPESFALLMARTDVTVLFRNLKFVIIDELHTFFDSKRGHLLSLNLARLRSIKPFQTIGLSATLKDTDLAKKYLSNNENTKLVSTYSKVSPKITILKSDNRIPWSGHSPRYALSDIYLEVIKFKSSILFVNTRAQAEILFESLWAINNKNKKIAIHHGSLEKDLRKKVEREIVEGHIECVVATSSLDLGLDWGNIDLVMQIGAPKGVARLVQRIGRANHTINTPSRAILVPTNCFEFVECIAAKECIKLNLLEDEKYSEGSLDVLAQHIVGVAISKKFKKKELYKQVKKAWPYRNLNEEDFEKTLSFVENGGYSLQGYKEYSRLKRDGEYFKIKDKSLITRYRMNVGTIVEAEMLRLRVSNRYLGNIEEWFINGISPGDTFIFAGKRLMFEKVVGNIAYAQRGHGKRSSFYSDYTFGVLNKEEELVPIGKAYSGFTDEELNRLDKFVRTKTIKRFGPVREVEKSLVVEIAFDDISLSKRHKSGIALRFPRFKRIRWDKPTNEVETLEQIRKSFLE
ncbi:helicase-related protein, partial [Paracoccaceae bacterium]|nr:helicase-related protein [Paracoccaceae bacterium]